MVGSSIVAASAELDVNSENHNFAGIRSEEDD